MQNFPKYLKNLPQIIQEDNSLDPFSFELISLANLSNDDLSKTKEEVKDIELIHCDEFWELTEEIYKRLMLPTISQELQEFFTQLQETSSKPLQLSYQFFPWQEFKLTTANYDSKVFKLRTKYAEQQIQTFLDHLEIKDQNWINDLYDFDYKFNFESEVESLFRELAFDAWKVAKENTQGNTKATLTEANGGSHIYDLDTRLIS